MKVKFNVPGFLWNGKQRLPGELLLTSEALLFNLADFEKSHLNLQIPLEDITSVELYLIFDLARKGLKVTDKYGKFDLFVLDDPVRFRRELLEGMGRN